MTRICFLNPFGTDAYDPLIEGVLTPSLGADVELGIKHLENFVIGCCYDPGLLESRELSNIPVIGPLETSVSLARVFGHRFAVVADHRQATPYLEDLVRMYGFEANCRAISAVDWFVEEG